jgi:putative ABC transport system ATP-binding protein
MTAATPLLAFDHVTVEIDGRRALTDLSCEIPDAGITVVVGPSGSGKTTLLRLCNRLSVPTAGTVSFEGKPLDEIDPLELRRAVGMVFQAPAPFPGSVRDNLAVAAPEASDQAMTEVLQLVDLDRGFLDRDAQQLSGGEAQRVCTARTLITRPRVLLLDEPTAALDVEHRLAFERHIRAIVDAGTPALWVTHDLDQARRIGDRWIVLVAGRIGTEAEARRFIEQERDEPEERLER